MRTEWRVGTIVLAFFIVAVACATYVVGTGTDDGPPARQAVLVLGDSLCVGARDDGGMTERLHDAGWEPEYACGNGIPIAAGIDYVVGVDQVPPDIVVALGTNRVADGEDLGVQLTTLREELVGRGAQRIVWVDYATSFGGYEPENAVLHGFVAGHGDVLVSWSQRSDGQLQYFRPDTVHHTTAGMEAWVGGILEALGSPG